MKISNYYTSKIEKMIPSMLQDNSDVIEFKQRLMSDPRNAFGYLKMATKGHPDEDSWVLLGKNLNKFVSALEMEHAHLLIDLKKTRDVAYEFSENIKGETSKPELENAFGTLGRDAWDKIAPFALNNINDIKESKFALLDLAKTTKVLTELSDAILMMKNLSSRVNGSHEMLIDAQRLVDEFDENEKLFNSLNEKLFEITE